MWTHTNLPIHTRVCDVDMKRETEREIHSGKQTLPAFEASTKHIREMYSDFCPQRKALSFPKSSFSSDHSLWSQRILWSQIMSSLFFIFLLQFDSSCPLEERTPAPWSCWWSPGCRVMTGGSDTLWGQGECWGDQCIPTEASWNFLTWRFFALVFLAGFASLLLTLLLDLWLHDS